MKSQAPPAPSGTMVIGRSALFLRGYDQESMVSECALEVGDELLARHEIGNKYDRYAVAVSNLAGKHIGRIAKEFSPGCQQVLQYLESSSSLQLVATFVSFGTEDKRHYENTLVHIVLHYFARVADEVTFRRVQDELRAFVKQQKLPFDKAKFSRTCLLPAVIVGENQAEERKRKRQSKKGEHPKQRKISCLRKELKVALQLQIGLTYALHAGKEADIFEGIKWKMVSAEICYDEKGTVVFDGDEIITLITSEQATKHSLFKKWVRFERRAGLNGKRISRFWHNGDGCYFGSFKALEKWKRERSG